MAYRIDPAGKETVLHTFTAGTDGSFPYSTLTWDKDGNLYGMASGGGDLSACEGYGCGVVFRLARAATTGQ